MRGSLVSVLVLGASLHAVGCGSKSAPPPPPVVAPAAGPEPPPPLAVSRPILDAWTKAGAKWAWCGPLARSGEFIFTDDLTQLDAEKAVSALELDERMIEGALAKLPRPDQPFAVRTKPGQWDESPPLKRARLLREVTALGKVVALEFGGIDPLTLPIIATMPDLQALFIGREYRHTFSDPPIDFSPFQHLKSLKSLVLRATSQEGESMAWVSALTELRALDICAQEVTDATADSLAKLERLERLVVVRCGVSPKGWRRLSDITQLKSLEVHFNRNATVRDLELARLAHLTSLSLSGEVVTDGGIAGLRGNRNLTALELGGGKITDGSAEVVATLTRLEALGLAESPVGDSTVERLAGLTQLRQLDLRGTKVTDSAMTVVAGLGELRSLNLSITAVGDAGVAHLRGLRHLRRLNLACPAVTNRSAPVLGDLVGLEFLNICDSGFSPAGVLQLTGLKNLTRLYTPPLPEPEFVRIKAAMPNCLVNVFGP